MHKCVRCNRPVPPDVLAFHASLCGERLCASDYFKRLDAILAVRKRMQARH